MRNEQMKQNCLNRRKLYILLTLLLMLFLYSNASADILLVGAGSQYRTIGAAVAAARNGDHIRVHPGVYKENIVLNRSVLLEGIQFPQINALGRGSVIAVEADNCEIKGFEITNSGRDLQAEDAGILVKSSGNRIVNNRLSEVLFGIYLFGSSANTVSGNFITGIRELEEGERGAGLHLWDSPDNILERNIIEYCRDGLYIQNSPGTKIKNNRVSKLRYGVHYMFSDSNEFEGNVFSDSMAGAAIMYSEKIVFRNNSFIHNRGFSSFGILLQDCVECIAENNFILDNGTGIFMEAVIDGRFNNNVIAYNNTALETFSSSSGNLFYENRFIENLSPLKVIGRTAGVRWSNNGRGNYWSDYDGYDLNGDGIGDVKHKVQDVFEYMEGNFPRLRLYLTSPAADSLKVAERMFPIVRGSDEFDPLPLMQVSPVAASLKQNKESWKLRFAALSLSGAICLIMLMFIAKEQKR